MKCTIVSVLVIYVSVMGIMMQVAVHAEDGGNVDRGYECFNLEIAQARLTYVRDNSSRGEIFKAYRSVRNWEKLCG